MGTTSLNIAKRFCGSDQEGVILKLMAAPGSLDDYFDVEWLSAFYEEKERLFVRASNMIIVDIRYFEGDHLLRNEQYLKSFRLFSSLFNGHFISYLLRSKKGMKQQKVWKLLVDLIILFKATNGMMDSMNTALNIKTPLYIQQLFFHLLNGFKTNKNKIYLIESEIDLLDDSLRRELVAVSSISDHGNNDRLSLSPFMQTLCSVDDIALMMKYIWIIDGDQFNELKTAKTEKIIHSEMYYFNIPDMDRVSFVIEFRRKSGSYSSTGIGIEIRETDIHVEGRLSVMVEEVGYTKNGWTFKNLGEGSFSGFNAFDDDLIDKVEMLTMTFALYLTPKLN